MTPEQYNHIRAHLADAARRFGGIDYVSPVFGLVRDAMAEVDRLRAELAHRDKDLEPYEALNPQQCPAGQHADWLVDSEYTHACPWCRVAELEAQPSPATMLRQVADKWAAHCPEHSDADDVWMDCPKDWVFELRREAELVAVDRSVKSQFPVIAAFLAEDPRPEPGGAS
ncbi:hypothetical protein I3W98_03675 [Streptomyces cavourensis]|nr:hypothetical protein [Streptomyces cavourensis]